MADSTPTAPTCAYSCFQRTVTLYDWWLVKSLNDFQGNRLAVAGVSSRKGEAVRVFISAPIVKRYDVFSLETADGIYVIIRGFINEQRALDNGIPPQVFNGFLFGFPPNWESYALDCFREESEAGTDLVDAVLDNACPSCQEILADGEEKSVPTSLVLPEEASGNCEKPFPGDECIVSKEMSEVDVANGSGRNRRSTMLHNIKACQQKQHVFGSPLKHPDKEQSSTSDAIENRDLNIAVPDNVPATCPEISSDGVEKSFPISLISQENTTRVCKESFLEDGQDMSIKLSDVNVVHGSGRNGRSARLHNDKVCQKKKHPASGGPPKNPDKEQSSTSKAMENCDSDTAVLNNLSAILPEISSNDLEKSFPISLVTSEKITGDCKESFLDKKHDMSINMSDVVHGSGRNTRSSRLHNVKVSQKKKQPASGGLPKHPDKEQRSTSKVMENRDSDTAVPNNVSANLPGISSDDILIVVAGVEKSFPTSLVTPKKAKGDCKESFLEDKHNMSIKMSELNVVHGSGRNRRSARLHNVEVSQKKKQPASGGPPKHLDKEKSSTSKVMENCDLDIGVLNSVSVNLLEISSYGVEKSFSSIPTSLVTPEKTTGDCMESFLEDEHNMSIKMSEVNAVRSSGGNRRSARLRNVKVCPKKQPTTGGPPKHSDKDQISVSAAMEKSDGGLESPSTPLQSQSKGAVNILSEQVNNKFASRISKTLSAKTEGCYKKKRVTVETEAVRPKRKMMRPASSMKSPQEKDASHLNKGSKQRLSSVTPESLSLKKSRSGRLLLPPLEFWHNQKPIYNVDREITEIQAGSSLISPFRGFSPSLGRCAEIMRGGKRIVLEPMQKL
ncbi:uncharacterized protein [Cicer arietinum]|uniref:uncharacterized protein isoform X3 n=1 Tax=Cicer arietinum TaxID=3827 RepID=UPI003CC599FB